MFAGERPHARMSIKVQKGDDFVLNLIHVCNKSKIKVTRKHKQIDDNISSFSLL